MCNLQIIIYVSAYHNTNNHSVIVSFIGHHFLLFTFKFLLLSPPYFLLFSLPKAFTMTNDQVADQFSLLSKLMDIHGENSFKSKTYSINAYNIEKLPREISEMTEAELFSMKGIGESTGKKILELRKTGKLAALEEIIAKTPPGILDMLQIKGLGPKKIAVIWNDLGIESVGELEYACHENRLVTLKGFGAKTQESVLQSIAYIKQNEGFVLWAEAIKLANNLIEVLQESFDPLISVSGGVRRQVETISCIDIVTDISRADVEQKFRYIDGAVIHDGEDDELKLSIPLSPDYLFHFVAKENYYHKLFTTTGSAEFMEAFLAKYTIPAHPASEEEIFEANNLQFIPPAMREGAGVLEKAAKKSIPTLIVKEDIKSIIHSHSKWSDGMYTIEQMAVAARDKGLEYLVISDHSQAAYYANGLTPERIAEQHIEVDALNQKLAPFKIFKSIEADILGDGSLDYSAQVLNTFDLVIASVHSNLKMSEEKAMSRVMAAIANPFTTILGHPTGRLLLSRKGYPLDHKAIIDACVAHNVVIEINAHPRRLDLDWRWIEYALEKGALLSVDPDAHSIAGFDDVYYGVCAAQKGGLTADRNLSSYTLQQFEDFLVQYRGKKNK